jgi:hypothetical protein
MSGLFLFIHARKVLFFVIVISAQTLFSRTLDESINQNHEITLYFITSTGKIKWDNPSKLLRSTNLAYLKATLKGNSYVIGHTHARITSTLLTAPLYTGMAGAVHSDKADLILKKKVGLGSLGATIRGKMETEESIKNGLKRYGKMNMVSYIKFKINAEAVQRMLQFIKYYGQKTECGFAPCEKYNGALWPRYEKEGSGCSAYVMTLLDVANIVPHEAKEWMVDINVPMDLIGGESNNNKKIKFSSILRTKSWYNGNGIEGVDFVNYKVFDPSIIKEWLLKKRNQNDSLFVADEEEGLKGVIVDKRNVLCNVNEPVIKQRTDTTLFVKHYYKSISCQNPE